MLFYYFTMVCLCWLEYGAQIGVGDGEDRKEEAFESGFKEFV